MNPNLGLNLPVKSPATPVDITQNVSTLKGPTTVLDDDLIDMPIDVGIGYGISLPSKPLVGYSSSRPTNFIVNVETFTDYQDLKFDSDHLSRHIAGSVPGSRFEGFASVEALEKYIINSLPKDGINYTTYEYPGGRKETIAELRIECPEVVGTEMVFSADKLKAISGHDIAGINLSKRENSQGIEAELDGIPGTWYPEVDFKTGAVKKDEAGLPLNDHFAFEPHTRSVEFNANDLPRTNVMGVIIRKLTDKDGAVSNEVLTAYPGENIPAIPKELPAYGVKLSKDAIDSFNSKYVFAKNTG